MNQLMKNRRLYLPLLTLLLVPLVITATNAKGPAGSQAETSSPPSPGAAPRLADGRLDEQESAAGQRGASGRRSEDRSARGNQPAGGSANRATATRPAADREPAARNASEKTRARRAAPVAAATEDDLLQFVDEHHRELADVLAHLKQNVPQEYERALRELRRQWMRLKQLEGRDRYAAELKLWKTQSRARLLGAKLQMGDDMRLNKALREKLVEVYDLRTAMLERDRQRAAERLAKLEGQLKSRREQRDQVVEKQLLALTKSAQKRTKPVKSSARGSKPNRSGQSADGKVSAAKASAKTPATKNN